MNELIIITNQELNTQNEINESIKKYAQNSLSFNTKRAYKSDINKFNAWCKNKSFESMPAIPHTVAAFISDEANNGISPPTLVRRIAAIKLAHQTIGYESPTLDILVRTTLNGIKRTVLHKANKKAPATDDRIEKMISYCDKTICGLRDKALLLLGFAGAFRRSELVSLEVENIEHTPDGIKIIINKSKTDQSGNGQTIAILNSGRFRVVDNFMAWLEKAGIKEGYIFRQIKKGNKIQSNQLTSRSVANIVKKYANLAGLTVSDFSGHSLRSGFLTSAARSGASPFKMMEVSRHKSIETLSQYIRSENIFSDHAGKKFL
jgi:site-specific recombinase XerD